MKVTISTILFTTILTASTLTRKPSPSLPASPLAHFHTFIKNGQRITISISKHGENPLKALWYKTVKQQGERAKVYTRSHPSHPWTEIPPNTAMASECSEGWEIGKVVARTITYLAMHQDSLKQLLGGATLRGEKRRQKTVDMEKVTQQVKKVVQETARCIKKSFSMMEKSVKEGCIHKAIVKEAKILIEKIKSKAAANGFVCSYSALVKGECVSGKKKAAGALY